MSLLLASLRYGFLVTFIHPTIWYIIAFVFALTALSLWLGLRGGRQSSDSLVKYVLGGTVLRLVLSVIAIYVALRLGVSDRLLFVLNFMAVYLLFPTFEIYTLLTTLRANFENPT